MNNKLINNVLLINIVIVLLEIIGLYMSASSLNINTFAYYTTDSNILLFISSAILIYNIIAKKTLSKNMILFRYTSIVSVSLTFIVVITVLSWGVPGGLKHILFDGSLLYLHTLCPILAVISFIYLEEYDITVKDVFKSTAFTLIYAAVLIILNIFGIVTGPYPFLMVTKQALWVSVIWIIIIYLITLTIALLLKKLNKK